MTELEIDRRPSPPRVGTGRFVCGAAERDITPNPGFALAGFSLEGQFARGVESHLFARVLYLRDTDNQDFALCIVDMMSGSRILLERVAARTVQSIGLGVDRIILMGTHTHAGPGWFYGNSLYDTFATKEPGFDNIHNRWLAARIAEAVEEAHQRARPGGVAVAQMSVWDVARNRSLGAFRSIHGSEQWNQVGFPGANPDPKCTAEQRAVDPRLRVLVAQHDGEAAPAAVFGFFGCHATTMGPKLESYSADWPGRAVLSAREVFEKKSGGTPVVVAFAPSAEGDVNGWREELLPSIAPGRGLAEWVGERLGKAMVDVAENTKPAPCPIKVWFSEPAVTDPPADPKYPLASSWLYGAPTAGGSEESPSFFRDIDLTREPHTSDFFSPEHPHFPKAPFFGPIQELLKFLLSLNPCLVHPLHAVSLGETLFVSLPGEPTIWAGHLVESTLAATHSGALIVLPCAGDYGGYIASENEYMAQHYEGSSTIFGRNMLNYFVGRLSSMLQRPPQPPIPGMVRFETVPEREGFRVESIPGGIEPDAQGGPPGTPATNQQVSVTWKMHANVNVVFANGPWVTLQVRNEQGNWEPLIHRGRAFNDANHPIHIQRLVPRIFGSLSDPTSKRSTWMASFQMPPVSNPARLHVAERGGFPGFTFDLSPIQTHTR